jgi:hypothetical protein
VDAVGQAEARALRLERGALGSVAHEPQLRADPAGHQQRERLDQPVVALHGAEPSDADHVRAVAREGRAPVRERGLDA